MGQFDISTFRAIVDSNLGFTKPDRYRIRLPIPSAMAAAGGDYFNLTRQLEFYADSCDLVGVGMQTINISRYGYGPSEKKPISPTFQDIMITFYSDMLGDNLRFFYKWMSLVNNFDMQNGIQGQVNGLNSYEFNYKDDYVVDGMITLLDGFGEEIQTWHPRRMFPLHIPETKLAWSLTHDIMKLTVYFTYMDWYVKLMDTSNPQTTDNFSFGNQNETPVVFGGNQGIPVGINPGGNPPQTTGTVTIGSEADGG